MTLTQAGGECDGEWIWPLPVPPLLVWILVLKWWHPPVCHSPVPAAQPAEWPVPPPSQSWSWKSRRYSRCCRCSCSPVLWLTPHWARTALRVHRASWRISSQTHPAGHGHIWLLRSETPDKAQWLTVKRCTWSFLAMATTSWSGGLYL